MKVLTFNIKNQEKNNIGGAYERYMTLIKCFLDKGWEVNHISPKGFSNIENPKLTHHATLNLPFYPKFIPFLFQSFLICLFNNFKNEINLVVSFSALESLLGVILKRMNSNINLVVSYRGDSIANYTATSSKIPKFFIIKFLKMVDNIIIKNADLIIFLSEKNREDIIKRVNYKPKRIKVVYNGITPRLRNLAEESSIIFENNFIIGFVGLLYEGKGLNYLIDAFSEVNRIFPDSKLVIVGDGPDKQKFVKKVIELNLKNNVIFTGYQKNPIRYMKGFSLMVVPSLSEAFGMVILEALYVNIPVIGSNVGGIPEVLKYDDLLFQSGNTKDLESKIINLFQNKNSYTRALELCNKRKKMFMFNWEEAMIEPIKEIIKLERFDKNQ